MKVINKARALGNVTIIRKQSLEAAIEFEKESVDIIFIDAIHTYKDCKDDINNWVKVVKPNGVLSGHDYSTRFFGVIMAVNELLGVDNVRIGADSTWFYNK
jgi:predicted O-methyltransferase YrrM